MKCQYCNHNDAEHTFRIVMMGEMHEVHLCDECTEKFKQYHDAMQYAQTHGPAARSGRPAGESENPFPDDAGEGVKIRRKLNGLRNRLAEAVRLEQYEEAARLRDLITLEEKEVYACES